MKLFSRSFKNTVKLSSIEYGDSITDLSEYRPDPVEARNKLLSVVGQSTGQGVYDFKDGKIDLDFIESKYWSYMLALKRKDLDVTELNQIKEALEADVKQNIDKDNFEAELKKAVPLDKIDSSNSSNSETSVSE